MGEVKWIKLDAAIFENEKIKLITGDNTDSIVLTWIKLLCLAGRLNNGGVFKVGKRPYTAKMFADSFREQEWIVQEALEIFEELEMIEIVSGVVTIPNWNRWQSLDALEKKRERDRKYRAEQREKAKSEEEIVIPSKATLRSFYGRNNNVLLSEEEYDSLKKEYPQEYGDMIENLSGYMAAKGVEYDNHYATMCKWAKEDKEKVKAKKPAYAANNQFLKFQASNTDYDALEKELTMAR